MGLASMLNEAASSAATSVTRFTDRLFRSVMMRYYTMIEWKNRTSAAANDPKSDPLRTPVHRCVEYFVEHVWRGPLHEALPIEPPAGATNPKFDAVRAGIETVWEWSKFGLRKNLLVRFSALYGESVIKIVSKTYEGGQTRVYFEVIDPNEVTEIRKDERGRVTYIRLDIPQVLKRRGEDDKAYTHTEIWDTIGARFWEHDGSADTAERSLGAPRRPFTGSDVVELEIGQVGTGGNIPFAYAQFQDIGEDRGKSAFLHALPKIDAADTLATQLHRKVFRYGPWWAIENSGGVDSQGRRLPGINMGSERTASSSATDSTMTISATHTMTVGEETVIALPGNATMKCLVPQINLSGALDVIKAQTDEIAQDLPELMYYKSLDSNKQIATETLRMMMAPAEARVLSVRANLEEALIWANMLALSMAQALKLPGFQESEIGKWSNGDWQHIFPARPVWPLGEKEKAELDKAQAEADQARADLGFPLQWILRERGYSDDEIAQLFRMREEEQRAKTEASVQAFNWGGTTPPVNPRDAATGTEPTKTTADGQNEAA